LWSWFGFTIIKSGMSDKYPVLCSKINHFCHVALLAIVKLSV
jgi:hypothetical protein